MSWEQLLAIQQEIAQVAQEKPVVERSCCPRDGFSLVTNSDGIRGCTFCGWRSDQGNLS